jgi:hypothetical protein
MFVQILATVTAEAAYSRANSANSIAHRLRLIHLMLRLFILMVHTTLQTQNSTLISSVSAKTNSAFDTANTALATAAIAINYDNLANAAFDRANSANILAQSAFDTANTKVSKSGDTMTGDLKFGGGGGILNLPTNQIELQQMLIMMFLVFIAQATGVSIVYANTDVIIQANTGGATFSQWNFNKDGTITFPNSTVQTTAFTGDVIGPSC